MRQFPIGAVVAFSAALALAAGARAADGVLGVFGLSNVSGTTAFAVWVPVEEGQSVSGVRWYSSDNAVAFPELAAVAGVPDSPEMLALAEPMASDVRGGEMTWSEAAFIEPIASATSGLYLIFRLTPGTAFTHAGNGGGTGFGYVRGDGQKRCWATADGESWSPFSAEFQVAIEPILSTNKAQSVRILERPQVGDSAGHKDNEPPATGELDRTLVAVPNPSNPQTEIRFAIPAAGVVFLAVYDLRGSRVRVLANSAMDAGEHAIKWDGRDGSGMRAASGVYIVQLVVGAVHKSGRLVLVQ
jgi:hypothetical protein